MDAMPASMVCIMFCMSCIMSSRLSMLVTAKLSAL